MDFKTRIMQTDYKKAAKRFIILALCVVILGGVLVGITWRTQISEAVAWHQTYENAQITDYQDHGFGNGQCYINPQFENERDHGYLQYGEYENEHGGSYERNDMDFFDSQQFTQPTTGAKIVFWTVAAACALLALSYWLLIMAWLYKAAELASMNGVLWTILGLFGNLATVIVFLIIRSYRPACPTCGKRQEKASFCRFCGTAMYKNCTSCGIPIGYKDAFCPYCGHQADGKSDGSIKD